MITWPSRQKKQKKNKKKLRRSSLFYSEEMELLGYNHCSFTVCAQQRADPVGKPSSSIFHIVSPDGALACDSQYQRLSAKDIAKLTGGDDVLWLTLATPEPNRNVASTLVFFSFGGSNTKAPNRMATDCLAKFVAKTKYVVLSCVRWIVRTECNGPRWTLMYKAEFIDGRLKIYKHDVYSRLIYEGPFCGNVVMMDERLFDSRSMVCLSLDGQHFQESTYRELTGLIGANLPILVSDISQNPDAKLSDVQNMEKPNEHEIDLLHQIYLAD